MCLVLYAKITLTFIGVDWVWMTAHRSPQATGGPCCCLSESFGAVEMLFCEAAAVGIEGKMKGRAKDVGPVPQEQMHRTAGTNTAWDGDG